MLLEALAASEEALTFADLQRRLGWPKSSLHELLGLLAQAGYIELNLSDRTYRLGIRTWELGQAYREQHDLVDAALPVMQQIALALNETVQLAILDGIENVYLAKVDSAHPVRLQSAVGKRLYAHATGLGKALLAALPAEERAARLHGRTLPRLTAHTVTDLVELDRELLAVRQRGFAVDDEEYTSGLRCVAVTIQGHRGDVAAAMSVSIPLMRAGDAQLAAALSRLAAGSLDIARRLGSAQPNPKLVSLQEGVAARAAISEWRYDTPRPEPTPEPHAGVLP